MSGRTLDVIYDGQCSFCTKWLRVLSGFDTRRAFVYHDGNRRAELVARFPQLAEARFDEAMYVVAPGGESFRGFFAFRRMLWESPWLWLLLPLFYFPGAAFVGPRLYAWVARNRRSFGCRSGVCELPRPLGGAPKA